MAANLRWRHAVNHRGVEAEEFLCGYFAGGDRRRSSLAAPDSTRVRPASLS